MPPSSRGFHISVGTGSRLESVSGGIPLSAPEDLNLLVSPHTFIRQPSFWNLPVWVYETDELASSVFL